jgi:hypothetical protein
MSVMNSWTEIWTWKIGGYNSDYDLQTEYIPGVGFFGYFGSITLAFLICSLDVRFTVKFVFDIFFSVENSK